MTWSLDARIPVTSVAAADLPAALAGRKAAVLMPGAGVMPAGAMALACFDPGAAPHALACACCTGRPPLATALDRLFQQRVRGQCGWFDLVLAVAEDQGARDALATALQTDALTSARFRPG